MENSLKNGLMAQGMDISADEQVVFLSGETNLKDLNFKVPSGFQVRQNIRLPFTVEISIPHRAVNVQKKRLKLRVQTDKKVFRQPSTESKFSQ